MDAAAPTAKAKSKTVRHDLFVTGGDNKFRWSMSDSGVTLAPDSLSWAIEGTTRERPYSDIFSIRLQRASAGTGADVGICHIRFRDGIILNIHGGSAQGLADEAQNARYSAVMRDLHAHLVARDDTRHIRYLAGLSEGRYMVLSVTMVVAGLMFGVLPLGLLIMIHNLETLFVFVSAAGLLWGFYKLWEKNRPRGYSPRHVPEELLF